MSQALDHFPPDRESSIGPDQGHLKTAFLNPSGPPGPLVKSPVYERQSLFSGSAGAPWLLGLFASRLCSLERGHNTDIFWTPKRTIQYHWTLQARFTNTFYFRGLLDSEPLIAIGRRPRKGWLPRSVDSGNMFAMNGLDMRCLTRRLAYAPYPPTFWSASTDP
jgi:hypothetical protein